MLHLEISISAAYHSIPVQHLRLESLFDIISSWHLKHNILKKLPKNQNMKMKKTTCLQPARIHQDMCKWREDCNPHRGPSVRCLGGALACRSRVSPQKLTQLTSTLLHHISLRSFTWATNGQLTRLRCLFHQRRCSWLVSHRLRTGS